MYHVWSNVLGNGIRYELCSYNTVKQSKHNGSCGLLKARAETNEIKPETIKGVDQTLSNVFEELKKNKMVVQGNGDDSVITLMCICVT